MDRRGCGLPRLGASGSMAAVNNGQLGWRVWSLGGLMVVLGAVMSVLLFQGFHSDSYLYLAFYSIPSNTAITVFPHEPILIYFGKFANLWWTALAATAGTAVAGLLDHSVFVHLLNQEAVQGYKTKRVYRWAIKYFNRFPFVTILLAGFLPVPFFLFKFLSFSASYPLPRYLAALLTGRFPRYYLLAWVGAAFRIPSWILIGAFLFVVASYVVKMGPKAWVQIKARKRGETGDA